MRHRAMLTFVAALLIGFAGRADGQYQPMTERTAAVSVDSGAVSAGPIAGRGVIWSELVHVPGAASLRLRFDALVLGRGFGHGQPTVLRITALRDGGQQVLDAVAAAQWSNTSAYFNGDTLLLEVVADPTAAPSRVAISSAIVAEPDVDAQRTICGPDDDRTPSDDARIGRVIPNGCTAWIIDDANHCLLTAGHCASASFEVIEFNVPLSDEEGVRRHAHPDDQYVIDPLSVQRQSATIGSDWSYFGCFANPNTGKTPFEAQGAHFTLAAAPPAATGQTLRITGHGTTDDDVPPQWNRAQKTHTGQFETHTGNILQYTVDTTGGNSGSPVIVESTGEAIGIHTHGGCSSGGGQNSGTAIDQPALVNALNNPMGVCAPPAPSLSFSYATGPIELIDPAGDVLRVMIEGIHGGAVDESTPTLHYSTGDGFTTVDMVENELGDFEAEFPAIECGADVQYYISAATTSGAVVTDPADAPAQTHSAIAAAALDTALFDNGESDAGWSVDDDGSLEGGTWQRGIPAGGGDRGDPRLDFDASHQCWLTENVNGDSDVDGGPTRLVSPTIDLSGFVDPQLSYAVWFYTDSPGGFMMDRLELHLSDDDGKSWAVVDAETNATGWAQRRFRIANYVDVNDTFRMRYIVVDEPSGSIVEAAVDVVHIYDIVCATYAPTDVNEDGAVDVFDLLDVLAAWGPCGGQCPPSCAADIDANCTVDVLDLLELLAAWG